MPASEGKWKLHRTHQTMQPHQAKAIFDLCKTTKGILNNFHELTPAFLTANPLPLTEITNPLLFKKL